MLSYVNPIRCVCRDWLGFTFLFINEKTLLCIQIVNLSPG